MRGRKPHPTWRRELDGNPGHHPRNTSEPELPTTPSAWRDIPEEITLAPEGITEVARTEWLRLAPMLWEARQVTDGDRTSLIALCLEWGRYVLATRKITSLVVMTPSGYPLPNPYISIATKALSSCAKLWPELGLTPSSRARVSIAPGASDPRDPFAEFDLPAPSPKH